MSFHKSQSVPSDTEHARAIRPNRHLLMCALILLLIGASAVVTRVAAAPLFSSPFLSFDTGNPSYSVAIGDLNGDGKPDLATANYYGGSNTVSVFLGNGDGTFEGRTDFVAGSSCRSVAIGDLNGDGRPDLVTGNAGTDSVSVFLGNGDGSFGERVDFQAGIYPYSVAIGDLNGDGRPDLVTANEGGYPDYLGTVAVLLGNGDGTFGPSAAYVTGCGNRCGSYSVAIGDLNRDGNPDLVAANKTAGTVSVLLGSGDGTFGAKKDIAVGWHPTVAIGDLDGDGTLDLVTANKSDHTVSVLLGNGDGTFGAKTDFVTGFCPYSVVIGDLNGDGKPDLATANECSHTVSVLVGNGDGTFGAKADFATGYDPYFMAIGDVDGNGSPDLATANHSSTVSVLLGNGDGTLGAKTVFGAGTRPSSVAIGDLNGDGDPDLAVANWFGDSNAASVLLGNGDGTLEARIRVETGSAPISVAIGDLDRDGKPDLAMASGGVSVLLGNGDGTFGESMDFATGGGSCSAAIGDLNGDGIPDLATANTGDYQDYSGTVSVLLGNGDGTFGVKTDYSTGNWAHSVAIGDLNGDGKPDLATANEGSSAVSVLLGNGDGTFRAKTDFGTGSAPLSVAIGDLDGDGTPDLATANESVSTVSILLGNGDGTFGAKTDFGTGMWPYSVAIGDLNGDGKPDLAVANYGSNSVSVLLNIGPGATDVSPGSLDLPRTFRLLASRPNPCQGSSEIRFLLPSVRTVDVGLFDLAGRKVHSLVAGERLTPGEHSIRWDGRDGSGAPVRDGVYLVHVRSGRDVAVGKLIVLR
jgi:hypothetical protein